MRNRKEAKRRGMFLEFKMFHFKKEKKTSIHAQFTLPACHPAVRMLKIQIYQIISNRTTDKTGLRPFVLTRFFLQFHAI
jgi:hypothetical protein